MKLTTKGCRFDSDGDGNCHIHPNGCAPALEGELSDLKHKFENLKSSNLSLKEEAMLYFNLSEKADQKRVEVWIMLPINHREVELDWSALLLQGDTHIGPLWGLSPHDVEGRQFTDGASQAIQDLNIEEAPENAFAVTFNLFDLEWESGEPDCGLPSGWGMKAEVREYHFNPEEETE